MTADDAAALAQRALDEGGEADALPLVQAEAERAGHNAALWQSTARLHRALDRHDEALAAFARAAALAPRDLSIACGRALTASEAGLDALPLFEAAARIDPFSSEVMLGTAMARFAAGDGARAVADLDAELARSPCWIAGHHGLARLRTLMGDGGGALASLDRALAAHPRDFSLWHTLIHLLSQSERYAEMLDAVRRGRAVLGEGVFFDANEAMALSELGEADAADALFARVEGAIEEPGFGMVQARHLLRTGRADVALPVIERWLDAPGMKLIWPYAAVAWRLTGDPRWAWMEGDARLVSVVDLSDRLPPLDRLAHLLRGLHQGQGQQLGQSVRGGTQVDFVLTRLEPELRALRSAIVAAIEAHVAQLPPHDPAHPTLAARRDRPVRFSGSWSVRLRAGGSHASHFHPMGWLSSAFYVAVPERDGDAGWLTLGEPQAALGLDLPPFRTIEPRPGRLVLFPSTMWHGTMPFTAGERLTVAFDVAPPR